MKQLLVGFIALGDEFDLLKNLQASPIGKLG